MPHTPSHDSAAATLRSRAEEQLRHEPEQLAEMPAAQARAALHELHVHQIELEMQNEQLRATQAELEKARERYVELYDFAPVGYLTLNESGLILASNLTGSGLLGVERSGLLSLPFSRFVLREDQDTFYLCLRKVFGSMITQACEVRLRPVSGAPFYARLEAIQASQPEGPVCRLTLSDITAHKQAEAARRESERLWLKAENEERVRLAFEAGELGAWDQDFRTGKINCSERARNVMGFPPGAPVTWEAFVERIHPDDRPGFLRQAEHSTVPGGSGRFDTVFRIVLPDGAERWLRFVARCFDESGNIGQYPNPAARPAGLAGRSVRRVGVLADITRQKEAEALLASKAKHLEVLVQERTARLREAVGELEHFSYTLAHDLRAPLRAIKGYGDLLLAHSAGLSPGDRKFIERSATAAQRMDHLIVDALNYNKLVNQSFPLASVNCAAFLQELIESYPQFQEAAARISVTGPIPPVLGNPALLTQCFSNLLNNALKFVPLGQVSTVRIFAQDLDHRVRIWVEDKGIGIAEESQGRIFQMFQRLNLDYEGTGIGLALVKKAAERMGGAVGVESQPGKGSRFWVELNKPEP